MISPAIENAHSITAVVEIVNAANRGEAVAYYGGTELREGDQLAGQSRCRSSLVNKAMLLVNLWFSCPKSTFDTGQ